MTTHEDTGQSMVSIPHKTLTKDTLERLIIAAAELRAIYVLKELYPGYVGELEQLVEEALKCLETY